MTVLSQDYRGYGLDVVQCDGAGWQFNVYPNRVDLPLPPEAPAALHETAEDAFAAAMAAVDRLLDD